MDGSSKLKLSYVDRMNRAGLTSKEIDFIIWIALKQDSSGHVRGIHFKDVCSELSISIQKYYDICKSLQDKGLISWTKKSFWDRDIYLIGNSFELGHADYKAGFVKMTYHFLRSDDFRKMKAGAKLLALDCFRIANTNHVSYQINVANFFKKYKSMFGVTDKVLRVYLTQIRRFFSIGIKDGKYYITPLAETRKEILFETEKERCYKQILKAACHRCRITVITYDVFNGLIELFDQYKNHDGNLLADKMLGAIQDSIRLMNSGKKCKRDWIRQINLKLVHRMLRFKLQLA